MKDEITIQTSFGWVKTNAPLEVAEHALAQAAKASKGGELLNALRPMYPIGKKYEPSDNVPSLADSVATVPRMYGIEVAGDKRWVGKAIDAGQPLTHEMMQRAMERASQHRPFVPTPLPPSEMRHMEHKAGMRCDSCGREVAY